MNNATKSRSTITALMLIACMSLLPSHGWAHAVGQSYVFLSLFEDSIEGRVEIPVANLNQALDTNFKTDGSVTETDLEPQVALIKDFVREHLDFYPDGNRAQIKFTDSGLLDLSFGQMVAIGFRIDGFETLPRTIDVDYRAISRFDAEHRSMLVIENNWRTGTFNDEANVVLHFSREQTRQQLDLEDTSLWRGFFIMIESGIHHIAIGIDHILFILALLIPSVMRREDGRWRPVEGLQTALLNVVTVVTLFTIAHSITLSLATLEIVTLPGRLVESIIALSIILVALDIVIPVFKRRVWMIVFVFGLFHGFGFASVLADLGIHSNYAFLTLLGFNLGVEVGQLLIVLVAFPVLYLFRRVRLYTQVGMPGCASLMLLIAVYWFIERAFDVDLPAGEWLNRFTHIFV